LKNQCSPVHYGDDDYKLQPREEFPLFTLAEAASKLNIRKQRVSRLLRILQVPIHKVGTLVLLDGEAIDRLSAAIQNEEVKRGRKPNVS